MGIDSRHDDPAFQSKLSVAARSGNQQRVNDVLFSADAGNAETIANLIAKQDPLDRLAITGGVYHGCEGETQQRLVNYLKQHGISVTSIALDKDRLQPDDAVCRKPPANGVDASALASDINSEQIRRIGKDAIATSRRFATNLTP